MEGDEEKKLKAKDYSEWAKKYLDTLTGSLEEMIKEYREDKHEIYVEQKLSAEELRAKKLAILSLQREYLLARAKTVMDHEISMAEQDYQVALQDIEEYAAIRRRLEGEDVVPPRVQKYLEMIKRNEERDRELLRAQAERTE